MSTLKTSAISTFLGSLSRFYLNTSLSDCSIVFITKRPEGGIARKCKQPCSDEEGQQQQEETIPGHKLVLASSSCFFDALFLRWKHGNDQKVIVEYDGPEDLAAAKACIKVMYLNTLPKPEESSSCTLPFVQLLMKMIHQAEFWQAPGCIQMCIHSLSVLSLDRLGTQDINNLLQHLPDSVHCSLWFSKVKGTCNRWLLHTYGDVYAVITSDAKQTAFCELCPAAVAMWMESDNLAGVENDVAVLLTLWYTRQGQLASDSDLQRLSTLLRVRNLSWIRMSTLHQLKWFVEDTVLTMANSLDSYKGSQTESSFCEEIPHLTWLARPRCGKVPTNTSAPPRDRFLWRIPTTQWAAFCEKANTATKIGDLSSPIFYCSGAFFQGLLEVNFSASNTPLLGLNITLASEEEFPKPAVMGLDFSLGFETESGSEYFLHEKVYVQQGYGEEADEFCADFINWGDRFAQHPVNGCFAFIIAVHEIE